MVIIKKIEVCFNTFIFRALIRSIIYKEPTKCTSLFEVFYSQFSLQHVSAAIATIFSVILLLLHEYKGANVVSSYQYTTPSTHHLHFGIKLTISLH